MTKIKNFRISFRPREMARWLKANHQLQVTPALEASIEHTINDCKRSIQPAALYTTLTRATAEKATSLPLPEKAIAVSVVAITVGTELEPAIAEANQRQDALQTALLQAVRYEALQQGLHFAMRLLQDQAKEEESELTAPIDVAGEPLLPVLGTLLGVQRIGLVLDASNPQLPPYARLAWLPWLPISKPSKRSESSSRTEKVAVS